jgi:hypothetical protein
MGFWLRESGFKDCVGGWGPIWAFGWVKVGLKTVCRWLGPRWAFGWVKVG